MFMYIPTPDPTASIYFIVFCLLGILTCTQLLISLDCLSRTDGSNPVREKEKGVVAKHLLIQSLKTRSGLDPVTRCEPSTYQLISR